MVVETASCVHVVGLAAVCSKVLRLLAVLLVASCLLKTTGPVGGVEARPATPAVAGGDAVEVRRTAERDAFLRGKFDCYTGTFYYNDSAVRY